MSEVRTPGRRARGLAALATWWWVTLPGVVGRVSLIGAGTLGDGAYLARRPALGAAVPPLAVVLGFGLGALHPGPVFSSSSAILAVLALVSGLGAGPGAWTWLGFVLGDLFFADRTSLPTGGYSSLSATPWHTLTVTWLPLALSYLLLWVLLCVGPLLGTSTRWTTRALVRRSPALVVPAGLTAQVLVQGLFTPAWAYAVAFLLRPLWSFAGSIPSTSDIHPLQASAAWLGLVAALATLARAALEGTARQPAMTAAAPRRAPGPMLLMVHTVAQVALLSVLLSGIVGGVVQQVILVIVLTGVVVLRLYIVPRWRGWTTAVRRVPVVLRIVVSLPVGYVLTLALVEPRAAAGEQSFVSMLTVVVVSLAVGALLLPSPAPDTTPRARHAGPEPSPGEPAPGVTPAASDLASSAGPGGASEEGRRP